METDKNGWELKGWELRFEKSADLSEFIKDCIYITKILVETDKKGWELKGWELRFEKS